MTITTKKYIIFGLAICLLFLSINFIGFETTVYIESALKGTCDTFSDKELDCNLCNCNLQTINCEFECKKECEIETKIQQRNTRNDVKLSDNQRKFRPINEWHTSVECFRTPDYSDICIYDEICFNGKESLFFITPSVTQKTSIKTEIDVRWDARFRFPKPFPPSEKPHLVPIGANTFSKDLFAIPPSNLTDKNSKIFEEGVMWISRAELDVLNPFFFAKDTLNLFEALMINETNSVFPPMDYLAILRKEIPQGWAQEFLPVLIQNHTSVVVYNYFEKLSISDDHLICFPKFVFLSFFLYFYLFSNIIIYLFINYYKCHGKISVNNNEDNFLTFLIIS